MPRNSRHQFTLTDGRRVGYSFKKRGKLFFVVFADPDVKGRYLELGTGCTTENDAHIESAKIVLKRYTPKEKDSSNADWDTVYEEIKSASGLRAATIKDHLTTIGQIRQYLPESKSPSDITPTDAQRFKKLYSTAGYRRGSESNSELRQRSSNSVRAILRKINALFNKHFKDNGYVTSNPFDYVTPPPATKKSPRIPTDEQIDHFFKYLETRYPDWKMIRLLIELKMLCGCRTLDICQLKSNQLSEGRLTFKANQTKGRADRTIKLPDDLYNSLNAIKGSEFLWESYVDDVAKFRPVRSGNPTTFEVGSLYYTIGNLFREYSEANPEMPRLSPHSLRRRAITLLTLSNQSVDATAQAIGVDPQTARKHYLDAQKAFNSDELFTKMADILRGKTQKEDT